MPWPWASGKSRGRGSQEDLAEVNMFVDSGPAAKPEDRDATQGRLTKSGEQSLRYDQALRCLSPAGRNPRVFPACRHHSGQCPHTLPEEGPLQGVETVDLALNQGHWGAFQKHFDRGPIIVTYTGEKGGQFKESLDETTALQQSRLSMGRPCGHSVCRAGTLTPFPSHMDKDAHPRSSPAPVIHKHERGPRISSAWLGTRGTGSPHTIDPVT